MLEWDILNYLKKWRTNLRATLFQQNSVLPYVLCGKTVKQRNLIQQKTMKKLQKILECILAFLMFLRGGNTEK